MTIIDGKETAKTIKAEIANEVKQMMAAGMKQPHLAAILVGHDGGSETYVAHKVKACAECGFKSTLLRFEDDVTEKELLEAIEGLNRDADVDGFIVQLPLPRHIDEQKVIAPHQGGTHVDWATLLPLRHSARYPHPAGTLQYFYLGQTLCGAR